MPVLPFSFRNVLMVTMLLLAGVLVVTTPRPASAEFPIPMYTSTPEDALSATPAPDQNPFFDMAQGGGLPGPFTINDPPEGSTEIARAFWKYENMVGMVRMFQTTFLLAQRNWQISLFVAMGVFVMVIMWLVGLIRDRGQNL